MKQPIKIPKFVKPMIKKTRNVLKIDIKIRKYSVSHQNTYRQTYGKKDIQKDRQTDGKKDRHKDRKTKT